jgi:hypothetical protein
LPGLLTESLEGLLGGISGEPVLSGGLVILVVQSDFEDLLDGEGGGALLVFLLPVSNANGFLAAKNKGS